MEINKRSISSDFLLSPSLKRIRLANMFGYRNQSFGYAEKFQELREMKKYCDLVLLSCDAEKFDVHRLVVFSQIPKLGDNCLTENSPAEHNVAVPGQLLKAIIDYCYVGELNIPLNEDLFILWNFCQTFELTDLKCSVESELGQFLTIKNSLSFLNILNGNNYEHETLRQKCLQLVIEGFDEVINWVEFLQLSPGTLTDILSSDDLLVQSEEKVLEALLKWYYNKLDFTLNSDVNGDFPRVIGMETVLPAIRLPLIRPEISLKFRKIWENNEQMKLMYDYSVLKLMGIHMCGEIRQSGIKPRSSTSDRLIIIRMELKDERICLDMLKFNDQTWKQLPYIQCSFDGLIFNCEMTKLDNENIMLIGGRQCNGAHCLNLKSMQTRTLKPMLNKRMGSGVASINGIVYVAGGSFNSIVSSLAERYDPVKDKWESIAPMRECRTYFQLVATENALYAIGGCDNKGFLKTVERYDIKNDCWQYEEPMLSIRCYFASVVHGNFIYVLGGNQKPGKASQYVERFNLLTNEWSQVASLTYRRNYPSAVVCQNQIFAIGGYNSCMNKVNQIEVYDEVNDKWIEVASLNTGGQLAAFAVPAYINKLFRK